MIYFVRAKNAIDSWQTSQQSPEVLYSHFSLLPSQATILDPHRITMSRDKPNILVQLLLWLNSVNTPSLQHRFKLVLLTVQFLTFRHQPCIALDRMVSV